MVSYYFKKNVLIGFLQELPPVNIPTSSLDKVKIQKNELAYQLLQFEVAENEFSLIF